MLSRRKLMKGLAALGGLLLSPLDRFGGRGALARAQTVEPAVGDLYEGFLILPMEARIPSLVTFPEPGVPIFCGVGADRGGPKTTAVIESLPSMTELANRVPFPVYTSGYPTVCITHEKYGMNVLGIGCA